MKTTLLQILLTIATITLRAEVLVYDKNPWENIPGTAVIIGPALLTTNIVDPARAPARTVYEESYRRESLELQENTITIVDTNDDKVFSLEYQLSHDPKLVPGKMRDTFELWTKWQPTISQSNGGWYRITFKKETPLVADIGGGPYTITNVPRLVATNGPGMGALLQTNFIWHINTLGITNRTRVTTNELDQIVKSGQFCELYGHQWKEGPLKPCFAAVFPACSGHRKAQCSLCGKQEEH